MSSLLRPGLQELHRTDLLDWFYSHQFNRVPYSVHTQPIPRQSDQHVQALPLGVLDLLRASINRLSDLFFWKSQPKSPIKWSMFFMLFLPIQIRRKDLYWLSWFLLIMHRPLFFRLCFLLVRKILERLSVPSVRLKVFLLFRRGLLAVLKLLNWI